MGPLAAMVVAISVAVARAWPLGTRRLTRPAAFASSARIRRPVKIRSLASGAPMSRGRSWVPPMPGKIPSVVSGTPNTAVSLATMKSDRIASSQPPASAKPSTAAITGRGQRNTRNAACSKITCWTRHVSSVISLRSFRSPPARNAPHRGPDAVPREWQTDGSILGQARVLRAHQHAALARLRLRQHLVHGEDRRCRHAGDAQRLHELGRFPLARQRRDRLDEGGAIAHARGVVLESRVVSESGSAERRRQAGEECVGARADHREPVRRREGLVRRDHRGARALRLRHLARREIARGLIGHPHQCRLEERRRDFDGAPTRVALAQGGDDAERGPHARPHVDDRRSDPRRLLAGMTVDRHQAAVRLHQRIVAGQVAEGPPGPERRHRAVDDPRIQSCRAREVEPEFVDGSRPQALDEHVGAAHQPSQHLEATWRLEIEGEAFLVAIQRNERRALAAPVGRRPRPRVVPPTGSLDLDDLGSHVAEDLRAERAGDVLGQIGNDDAFEGVRHARSLSPRGALVGRPPPTGRAGRVAGLLTGSGRPALASSYLIPLYAEDLRKRLSTLNERFSALAESLAQTARQLQISGSLPPESLLDEITKARADFGDVRHRVLDAARALALNSPAMAEIDSIKALEPVLESVVQAVVAEEKRNAATEARKRVMAVLDRVLAIAHADGPNFAALVQCQAKAKEIQAAAQDPKAFDTDNAPAFLESTPSFAALLSMIDGREALDEEKFAALEDTVTQAFGRAVAVAATRGKLLVGSPSPAAPERPAQPAPKAAEPAVKPAAPTPPSAPPRPEPVIVGTGTPVAPPL